MLLIELLREATTKLEACSSSARLDAELLLAQATGLSKLELVLRSNQEIEAHVEQSYRRLLGRRLTGEPIAYILGTKEFFGLDFQVSPACLIPRPETELLVEKALERAKGFSGRIRILDLGTGSGCIAISLAHELLKRKLAFEMLAVDRSEDALSVARANAQKIGVYDKIDFICSDWFKSLKSEAFDLVLSNPPYIAHGDTEISDELRFEPQSALYAEEQGLACIREILLGLPVHLKDQGCFYCEIGARQSENVLALCAEVLGAGYQARIWNDLAGLPRLLEVCR